jgi:hypothetical protein
MGGTRAVTDCGRTRVQVCKRWWNFDDAHAYPGHHWLLRDGLGALATFLLDDADVELRAAHAASAVCARASGGVTVVVRALTPGGGELTVDADAAVIALPLGVLKSGDVAFYPPISHAKRAAVARMGFGLLNKVFPVHPSRPPRILPLARARRCAAALPRSARRSAARAAQGGAGYGVDQSAREYRWCWSSRRRSGAPKRVVTSSALCAVGWRERGV